MICIVYDVYPFIMGCYYGDSVNILHVPSIDNLKVFHLRLLKIWRGGGGIVKELK